jgi:hypothetical protein
VIRMEQYIPDTPAFESWNSLLVILMYCSILTTVSQEENSNLHMQGCQVCTIPFWSQYHKKRIPQNGTVHTWHPCICKLEFSSCDIVIRME